MAIKFESELTTPNYWDERADGGYHNLGWVKAGEPLKKMVELAQLKGDEVVVDAATGGQAVKNALAPGLNRGGVIFGFDISEGMLMHSDGSILNRQSLLVSDVCNMPFAEESVDLVTARMVYHNLSPSQIGTALKESSRVLKPGGRLIVCEYVTPESAEAWKHERKVFDIKEPDRNLWTGRQFGQQLHRTWKKGLGSKDTVLDFAVLTQYSVRDWMENSGLPQDKQQQVLDLYRVASAEATHAFNMTFTRDGDTLVDRPFAYFVAQK
jgi:SAM-dependent methyltransferase